MSKRSTGTADHRVPDSCIAIWHMVGHLPVCNACIAQMKSFAVANTNKSSNTVYDGAYTMIGCIPQSPEGSRNEPTLKRICSDPFSVECVGRSIDIFSLLTRGRQSSTLNFKKYLSFCWSPPLYSIEIVITCLLPEHYVVVFMFRVCRIIKSMQWTVGRTDFLRLFPRRHLVIDVCFIYDEMRHLHY